MQIHSLQELENENERLGSINSKLKLELKAFYDREDPEEMKYAMENHLRRSKYEKLLRDHNNLKKLHQSGTGNPCCSQT